MVLEILRQGKITHLPFPLLSPDLKHHRTYVGISAETAELPQLSMHNYAKSVEICFTGTME